MKFARTVSTLALLLAVASPVFAAGHKKGASKNVVQYYKQIDSMLKPITLTDDQKTKLDALKKDNEQKFKDAYAKENVLTPEQKKAGDEAKKAAQAAGKKGKELKQAIADAVKETDDQKSKETDAKNALHALEAEFRGKVMDLLTADQKAQIKTSKHKGKKSKAAA